MLFDNKLGELLKLFQNMTKGDKEKLNSILEKINKLDSNHKNMLLELLLEDFEKDFDKTITHQNSLVCNKEGHKFSDWIHCEWSEVATLTNFPWKEDPFEHKECWERTCTICGFIESLDKEPENNESLDSNIDKIARMKQLRKNRKKLDK